LRRQQNFENSFKGKAVSWEGVVVRVDSADSSNDLDSWIDISLAEKHKLAAAEVMVSMSTTQDYDLLLTLDMEHLQKNQDVLDKLHHGTTIKFKGFVSSIGKRRTTALEAEENGVAHLVSFSIEIVSLPDHK
jgi:hypothetical protein